MNEKPQFDQCRLLWHGAIGRMAPRPTISLERIVGGQYDAGTAFAESVLPSHSPSRTPLSSAFLPVLLPAGAAFVATAASLYAGLRSDTLRRAMEDAPNERSLHRTVIPRIGGLGILVGASIGLALGGAPAPLPWLLAACAALTLLSAIDDLRSIAASLRLAAHLLVAAAWTSTLGLPLLWSAPIVAGLVWSANLFNFMDGADGLAGGMAVIGLAAFGWVAAQATGADGHAIARVCFVLSGSVTGFLLFNFPPARLFLGDSGSIPLGFVAGALGVQGTLAGLWPPLFPLIVFFPFVFDATLTLAKRLAHGQSPVQAHREHLYQRAILAGLSHRQMTLRACAMMLAGAAGAIAVRDFPYWTHFLIIGLQAVIGAVLSVRIARKDAMEGEKA